MNDPLREFRPPADVKGCIFFAITILWMFLLGFLGLLLLHVLIVGFAGMVG